MGDHPNPDDPHLTERKAGVETRMKKPNIILILADDMGFSDIGCFGSEIHTPVLDRLAGQGMRFTGMCSNARCCPSRASLITGLYPHQAGIGLMTGNMGRPAYQGYLNNQCTTIAEVLKDAGYQTFMSGKWHVGGTYGSNPAALRKAGTEGYPTPNERGFDHFYGILEGAGNYYNPMTLMEDGEWIDPTETEPFYLTDEISKKAVQMISQAGEEPFFLYVAYNAPHWPLQAPEEIVARYQGKYLTGWEETRKKRFKKQKRIGIAKPGWKLSPPDPDIPSWEETPCHEWEDRRMAVYAAQIERMDTGIGMILDELNHKKADKDTLIVFLSDNGGCAETLAPDMKWLYDYVSSQRDGTPVIPGNDPTRMPGGEDTYMSYDMPWANVSNTPFKLYKHWIHEGGIAGPMIAWWPNGITKSNQICRETLHFIDILPTLSALAETKCPTVIDGRTVLQPEGEDFSALLKGEPWKRNRPVFWEHEGNAGVMDGPWKLVRRYEEPWELYNMDDDCCEMNDLSGHFGKRVTEMSRQWNEWAERVGVVDPMLLGKPIREE